jgi:hypothetical protein
MKNWHEIISDPEEVKVFNALDGPHCTWRTISGIARQTGLSEEQVAEIVAKYDLELTRQAETPSITGQPFVGLIENVGA